MSLPRRLTTTLATFVVWAAGLHLDARSPQRSPALSGVQAPTATGGGISGRVIDGSTGAPLAGALVFLVTGSVTVGAPRRQLEDSQTTDRSGQFLFGGLAATRTFEVLASKPGYFEGALGVDAVLAAPRRVTLPEGQWLRDVTIPLWRPSSISGTIVDETGTPAVGVHVGVVPQTLVSGVPRFVRGRLTTTDDRGAYRIAPLRSGTYAVMVPSIRFSVPTELPASPMADRVAMDSLAEPAGFTSDGRLITRVPSRRLDLAPSQHAFPFGDGSYLVLGSGSLPPPPRHVDGRRQAYHTRFYPAAASLREASLIDLAAGEGRAGVDVRLFPVPVSRVSGVVEGPIPANAPRQLRLMAQGAQQMEPGHEVATAFTSPTGSFTFLDVPDGQYTIVTGGSVGTVQTGPSVATVATFAALGSGLVASDGFFAETPVSVSGADRSDVIVRLRQGVSVTGRILIETPEDRTALGIRATALQVTAEPALGSAPTFGGIRTSIPLTAQALEFTLGGLLPGEYVLRMYGDSGTAKSIVWSGKDYTGIPITVADRDISGVLITVTSHVARARGSVRAADGTTARDAAVIYFPEDRVRWQRYGPQSDRLRSVPVRFGQYEVAKMPAGTYYLVAVHEGLADRWRDPAFLDAASRVATRVTIGWGETLTQDLTVVEIPR